MLTPDLPGLPGILSQQDFLLRSTRALEIQGFSAANTIAAVSVCRDEITRSFVDGIQHAWGEAFNMGALAGLLFLGRTGFAAARHHAPIFHGRERYALFAMAHIAVGPNGEIGLCHRPGRDGPSNACGALVGFQRELASGHVDLDLHPDDLEFGLLKRRLVPTLPRGGAPDLLTLTRATWKAIDEDLAALLADVPEDADYAVLTGVQVHGTQGAHWVWPGTTRGRFRGEMVELEL